MKNKLPELLAPAGNMERLRAAFDYGADAVYLGADKMSLRNFADNFTLDELAAGCAYAHDRGGRVYVACNAFARDDDLDGMPELLCGIKEAGADALIVNDPGVIRVARRIVPEMPLHISTQANTLNSEAAMFYHDAGAVRIILARELSIAQIKAMRARIPEELELEAFVHGAMCVSYSGRCLLSNYINGRDSNRGECAQPCRWRYELREHGSNGEYFDIEQDDKGTFLLNSRDLCLIRHIPELIDAGIMSLKIEGRMKSIAYVATVTNAYRMALDEYAACMQNGGEYGPSKKVLNELERASHRPYTVGFALGGDAGQETGQGGYVSDAAIAATVISYDEKSKTALISQRNKFSLGETLNILSPRDVERCFAVTSICTEDGEARQSAPHPKERLRIGCAEPVKPGDIMRKM